MSKRRPCLRCGGEKVGELRQGQRYCSPCQEVVDSADHQRDLNRKQWLRRRAKQEKPSIRRRTVDAPEGQKWCARCQRFLPFASFATNGAKLAAYCIPCNRDYNSERRLLTEFGMTQAQYDELLDMQDGRCAICQTKPRKRRLAVDHDHDTGQVRGLLCTRCNHGILGKAHDSADMLIRAALYLQEPPARTGVPITHARAEQGDLEFFYEQLPFLKDGEVAQHSARDVVAVTPRSFLALVQAAGLALVIDGMELTPDPQSAVDDLVLLEQVHRAYNERSA